MPTSKEKLIPERTQMLLKRATLAIAGAAACFVLTDVQSHAGPLFDEYLNYTAIDQTSTTDPKDHEGVVLVVKNQARWEPLTPDKPLGQTFTLSGKADKLWRVMVGLCHWPDSWQQGEAITFILYDSPAKSKKLYSRTIPWEIKTHKWDTPFEMRLQTKPGTSYYFELTHNGGGDKTINVAVFNGNPYPAGDVYQAGRKVDAFDLVFTAFSKPEGDRKANLKRFLDKFDYTRPEMAAAKKAYDAGKLELACSEIVKVFDDSLRKADWVWRVNKDDKRTVELMTPVITENRLYSDDEDKKGFWIPMDSTTTWREGWRDTTEYPRPNELFARLGQAYWLTKNEAFAKKMAGLSAAFANGNTSPFDGGVRGFRWVAMHQAWRLGDAWAGWANAVDSKAWSEDHRLIWIDYWRQMALFARNEPSGGNHANAVAEAVMGFTRNFPMYKFSSELFVWAFDKGTSNSLKLFRNDGGLVEPAMNYHGFSLINLMSLLDQAAKYGKKPSPELLKTVENAHAFTAYMLMPDGQPPTYGDTDAQDVRGDVKKWDGWRKGEAMTGAKMFNRKDLLFIATAGKEGERPAFNSYQFPDTRHYILRSGWGGPGGEGFEDERWLFLRGGHMGSHGHWDMNQIILYAYGRPIIFDPGRTDYHNQPLMRELTSSRSSSGLVVDGLEMQRKGVTLHAFKTSDALDYVDNEYPELFPGVGHRRVVLFVRPNYYVMLDIVKSDQPRKFGPNFVLIPQQTTVDQAGMKVNTNDPKGSNVVIAAASDRPIEIGSRLGNWDFEGERSDLPIVTFWTTGQTEAVFATALVPYPKGESAPKVDIKLSGDIATGLKVTVTHKDGVDEIVYKAGASPEPGKPGATEATLRRTDKTGKKTAEVKL